MHGLERFKTAYSQIEQVYYGTIGTIEGLAASTTFRDLQDQYVGSKKVRFEKPGFNLEKWQKNYYNRYNPFKGKKGKGDVYVNATSSEVGKTLSTDESINRGSGRSTQHSYRRFGGYVSKNRRSKRRVKRCNCKGVLFRVLAARRRQRRKRNLRYR